MATLSINLYFNYKISYMQLIWFVYPSAYWLIKLKMSINYLPNWMCFSFPLILIWQRQKSFPWVQAMQRWFEKLLPKEKIKIWHFIHNQLMKTFWEVSCIGVRIKPLLLRQNYVWPGNSPHLAPGIFYCYAAIVPMTSRKLHSKG